jgi:hypothetical protein
MERPGELPEGFRGDQGEGQRGLKGIFKDFCSVRFVKTTLLTFGSCKGFASTLNGGISMDTKDLIYVVKF